MRPHDAAVPPMNMEERRAVCQLRTEISSETDALPTLKMTAHEKVTKQIVNPGLESLVKDEFEQALEWLKAVARPETSSMRDRASELHQLLSEKAFA